MRLYYADIRGLDEGKALYPPISKSSGSAFGVSLLALAYEDYNNATMPLIKKLISGKPWFPSNPSFHFSISHSRTHVLCAVSKHPVGVDTADHRNVSSRIVKKLTTAEEREHLTFFEIWALRESLFKLEGKGDLRTMRFIKKGGNIIPPVPGVKCRLYEDIDDSSVAVCTRDGDFPNKLIKIPSARLLLEENKLSRMMEKEKNEPQ